MTIKTLIRTIPHYPHQGIMFRDITTLLKDPIGLRSTVDQIAKRYKGQPISKVAGIESRGFIIGAPVAYLLGVGFVPIRKKGKLPAETIGHDYELEYGADRIEIHTDAISPGERVLLVDDLIATGGTAEAAAALIARWGPRWSSAASSSTCPTSAGASASKPKASRSSRCANLKGSNLGFG